jgi:WD40 repeat protein/energy-coupling factor transporter ATP-binding protein EcfA2
LSDENKANASNINAENNSIAIGGLQVDGDVSGNITIGNTTGYTAEQVSVLITRISSTFQPKPFDGRCPYKGLDVFEEEDAELFFGREKLVDDLVSRVKGSRTVFVTGPSGSGKSSLVRAGLIHTLKQDAIKGSERWLYATMKPGRDPIGELGRVVSSLASSTNPEDEIRAKAMTDITIFARWCEIALKEGRDRRVVLFIDQFEEVFTQINKEEDRVAFLNLLTHAATIENGRVIILFSMRSDFVSNCATYPQLNALLNQQFVQIGAMQPEELVSAIAQPALRVGLRIDPDLIAQIINEMKGEPGALPLMQFALKDLFDSQQEKSGVIALTLNDYLQRGGIHKALERHADDSFSKLSNHEQELARSIFSGLIEIGRGTQDTKRTALFDELVPANAKAADVESIVQKLADARLITTDEQAGKDTVTISHEKLIDAWPWLKKLVNENRDVIALQNEIKSDAKEWDEHQRDNSYLYSGARLAIAQEKIKDLVLSENAQTYLTAAKIVEENIRLKSKRTQRIIITGLLIFSSIVLGLLLFSLLQLKISRAQRLGSQAQVAFAQEDFTTALLYAYQSNQIYKNDTADLTLSQIVYKDFAVGKVINGHTSSVYSVAWSADGQLASGGGDNTIIIWDIKTGQPAQTLIGHTGPVISVAWSADGRLASTSWDKTIIIWDLKIGQPAQILKGLRAFDGFTSVAWSTDGRLASGSSDNTIIIWDLKTGQPAQILKGHTSIVSSVAWSVDGRLASGSYDNTIIIWDLKTGQPSKTLTGHTNTVNGVAWSADGRLASGADDNTIIIWDLKTGQPAQTLRDKANSVRSVAWSADGQLASGSNNTTTTIWDLNTGRAAQTLKGHTSFVSSVAWSTEGRLASGSWDNKIIIWDLKTGKSAQTLIGTSSVSSVALSEDGQLASGSGDKTIIIWDLKTGKPAQTLIGHTSYVSSVAWSADGQLASGSQDGTVIIWDLKTGKPAQTLIGHTSYVSSVAWSADRQLASGSGDKTIIIWDLKTGQPAQTLKGYTDAVDRVAWSTDGLLASGSHDGTVIIWDLKTGIPAQTLKGHTDWILGLAWSTDGRLASGSRDNTIIIWDLKTGQPAQTLIGQKFPVTSVAWSADGQLASGSDDKTIIIWDLKTGQPAQTFKEHTSSVVSLAWSVDGQLASGSVDWTIKIARADLTVGDLCKVIMRNLTLQEWIDYQGLFYIYQPACSNLYDPSAYLDPVSDLFSVDPFKEGGVPTTLISIDPLSGRITSTLLITWEGRAVAFALLLAFLIIVFVILWISYKVAIWLWRKIWGGGGYHP